MCNGNGVPNWSCDCNGNQLDCLGICGGSNITDECGICNGDGKEFSCCDGELVCNPQDCQYKLGILKILFPWLYQLPCLG